MRIRADRSHSHFSGSFKTKDQLPDLGVCGENSKMCKKCRKCGTEMEVIDKNRRQLIEEVTEVHYHCPECGYEIIVPKTEDE